ncbi:restriction endonuclease [Vibrio cholerae]|uniref:restriction endonuclease n=1 Tax=Vibrio cholerae TaxID=666 RepID=UPI001A2B5ADB|nr:restriction endonuclease [Vibrio cholerae]EGR5447372.1 restriction endonuclease [Vibrio cholerae]EGR5454244.1 restriction endonuclease [Vibrio cholerae]EGR5462624.1 restriction endonuclease [Vibrio cholerae]EKF9799257.1 restriction endonuclease [Vibrio cholerae]MCD1196179.1 hypothetical protein [Vibrio cholerae]
MDLLSLSPEQFESMTFDIVTALGLRNAVWRTPGSDVGRDIEGNYYISDLSGLYQKQKWYVECKRYAKSVDWPTVWNKIAYAETHSADILLFVTSSSLSPQAVDQVRTWNESNKKPTIRFWGESELISKLNLYPQIAKKYQLKTDVESKLDMFVPSVDLLLAITNSTSPDVGNVSKEKLWLTHSISELISVRMHDIESGYGFHFKPHRDYDYFEWSKDSKCDLEKFDRYSTRALLAYLCFIMNQSPKLIQQSLCSIEISLPKVLIESQIEHIKVIAYLSNFNVIIKDEGLVVSLIERGRGTNG